MEKVRERRLLPFSHTSADMMAGIVIPSPLQAIIVKMVLKTRPDVEKEQKNK